MPALPLDTAGPYVAGAYLVFLGLVLTYVAIMAGRLARINRDIAEIVDILDRRDTRPPATDAAAHEAAVERESGSGDVEVRTTEEQSRAAGASMTTDRRR